MKKFEKIDLGLKEAYEELFMNDEERKINRSPRVLDIEISQIDDFEGHPFKVKDDEDMEKLMESIATYGVLTPVIIREKGDRYEMVSGHRRKHACARLGMETIPAVIKELSREAAIIIMADSNIQRENILPSEKAKAYKMKMEALSKQGKRTDLTSTPMVEKLWTVDKIGKGKFNGGMVPVGYYIDENQNFQTDPITAPFVVEVFQRYDRVESKTEIRDWLNKNHIKNSKGTDMTYSPVSSILKNRKYIGEYSFHNHINYEAIPPIIDKELFERVQMRHERNKKAPAHFKADEEYILSSKLVCGHCGTYMCGESGTGGGKIKYHYYKCMAVKKKKNNCKKKTVRKEWIEDIVIREITKIIFDDNTIESIISMVMKIQEEDNKEVPMYEKQLESVKRSIDNTLNAIKMGIFTESTKQMFEELEQQKKNLEEQIAEVSFKKPMLKPESIRNWLYRLRTLNPEKLEHRRVLVDTFVNKIFLYDDKIIVTFNYKSDSKEVTLKEIEVSDIFSGREPKETDTLWCPFSFAFDYTTSWTRTTLKGTRARRL